MTKIKVADDVTPIKMGKITKIGLLNQILEENKLEGSTPGTMMRDGNTITTHYVLITPELATSLIRERNTHNRKITDNNVKFIVKAMAIGQWVVNGDSITFNKNGILVDGQHRLAAIIKSNTPCIMIVHVGVEENAFETKDTGRKRTAGDTLSVYSVSESAAVSSSLQFINSIEKNRFGLGHKKGDTLNNQEIYAYYKKLENVDESIQWGINIFKTTRTKYIPKSMLIGFHFVLSQVDRDLASEFMDKLYRGVGLEESSPIILLREKLARAKSKSAADINFKMSKSDIVENVTYTWKLFVENETQRGSKLKVPTTWSPNGYRTVEIKRGRENVDVVS